jgi:hypothetical protein
MNVVIGSGGKEISWDYAGATVSKSYSEILMGYEILPDNTGIILLEPTAVAGSENAVIYNSDGSLRWRLPFPKDLGWGLCFDRVGISGGQLVVIGIVNNRDVKFEVDYDNLKYLDVSAVR